MPVQYNIRADIIDIRSDSPSPDDVFMVDTNAWYWFTYTRDIWANKPSKRQIVNSYISYINVAISVKSKLLRCDLSLSELSHIIERNERDIFSSSKGHEVKPKLYRHNYPFERNRVVSEIQAAWSQIEAMSKAVAINIDETVTKNAMNRLTTELLDGYDLFVIEAILRNNITSKVITDDGDFATVGGIEVFTANDNVINAPQSQGRLIAR
ncbi:MAG: hypothetical protein HQL05_10985 [Nitrospirae bacterium]|uniref:hypothetical protein n=1 Tax=Candidatus Magnetobacterium casense TaxID=1455061 RepID=UPI00058D9F81|nr:hypothetical protein [Candidatus Magnetobacterium casensis]MBF0338345.1 hypothetical protein [Nitrospirota bacterium]